MCGDVDLEQAAGPALDPTDTIHPLGNVFEGRRRRLHQRLAGLGQRDAARRAREQRLANPLLDQPHRVADRRRAHAEFGRGKGKAAAPRNGDDDGQMAKQVAIHS